MTTRLHAATVRLAAHASIDAMFSPNPSPRLVELATEYDAAFKESCDLSATPIPYVLAEGAPS